MADTFYNHPTADGGVVKVRLVDQGGGVYSPAVGATFDGDLNVGPVTVADGADANAGATDDAAVVTDADGTLSGKIRGLVKIFADVWDSVSHKIQVVDADLLEAIAPIGSQPSVDASAVIPATDSPNFPTHDTAAIIEIQAVETRLGQYSDAAVRGDVDGWINGRLRAISTQIDEWIALIAPIGSQPSVDASSVIPATDSDPFPISASALPLPGGAATAVNQFPSSTGAVSPGSLTDTVIKAAPGQLFSAIVTAAGAGDLSIFDNDTAGSGSLIGYIPAAAAAGSRWEFMLPAAVGITALAGATAPGVTIGYN